MSESTESSSQNSALKQIPILETDNWAIFKRRANEYIILAGYSNLLEDDDGVPEGEQGEKELALKKRKQVHKEKMLRACTAIRSRCGANAHAQIKNVATLREVMKLLEENCKNQGSGSLIELLLEFWDLRLKDFKHVTEYAEKFREINEKLADISESAQISDLHMVVKFIHNLDSSFDTFKATFLLHRTLVNDSSDRTIKVVSFSECVRAAQTEEKRIQQSEGRQAALVALPATASSTSTDPNVVTYPWCTRCEQRGHNLANCFAEHPEKAPKGWRGKEGGKRRFKNQGKKTSTNKNKFQDKKKKSHSNESDSSDDDVIAGVSWMDDRLGSQDIIALSALSLADDWLLDTGCSHPCTHKRDNFISFRSLDNAKPIKGIKGVQVTPSGIGIARLPTKGKTLYLKEVYYVPQMGVNLISPGQLEQLGYTWGPGTNQGRGAGNGMWIEVNGSRFTSTKKNNVYVLDLDDNKIEQFKTSPPSIPQKLTPNSSSATKPTTSSSSVFNICDNPGIPIQALFALAAYSIAPELIVWHERMGHLGEDNLKKLSQVADGVKLYKHHKEKCTCEGCVKGAMRKRPHNKASKPGRYPMEFIVFDLVSVPITGDKGERYFGHIMDFKTRWGDTKCFKSKAEAFDYFCEFQAKYERPGQKIRRVRLDNGELKSKRFHDKCAADGITHEETVPHNPEQNGSSERHGQTIWRKVETILQTAGIALKFWPQIVETACYLANRSPHSALQGRTPYEQAE